jgi:hypothetical protein
MPDQKPFQRLGADSNAQVGRDFEAVAQRFFVSQGITLQRNFSIDVGIGSLKKPHSFDLGCSTQRWLVECKCHRWTTGHKCAKREAHCLERGHVLLSCRPVRVQKGALRTP